MVREPKCFRKTPEYANPKTWYRSRQNILKPSNPARAHLKPSWIQKQGFPHANWYTNRVWQAAALKNLEKSKICYRKKFGARKPQKHGTTIQPCHNAFKTLAEPGHNAFRTPLGTETAPLQASTRKSRKITKNCKN